MAQRKFNKKLKRSEEVETLFGENSEVFKEIIENLCQELME